MYDMEVWSIFHEQDTCAASVKELEEALAVEELTDEEAELAQEKVCYDAKRIQVAHQKVVIEGREEEGKDEGESKEEEEEEDKDEPVCSFGLLAEAKGKHPTK